jgi:hypothetical protein
MTSGAPATPQTLGSEPLIAALRRSIVGVRSASARGTGWVALANGLVVARHRSVGYDLEVTLELEGGSLAPARVIWADVAHDVAFLLPRERLGVPPVFSRPDLPRLAEPVLLFEATPGAAFRALPTTVCAIDRRLGQSRFFEIELSPALVGDGGPIVDAAGRVIGIAGLDLRDLARWGGATAENLALPIASLHRAFAAFDLAASQLAERAPVYHCPACSAPFTGEDERCLACGRLLPRAWSAPGAKTEGGGEPGAALSAHLVGAERLVREILAGLGVVAAGARVGPRRWRLSLPLPRSAELTEVELDLDADGRTLRGRVPVVKVPGKNHEAFYRFLLSANDQASGSLRLSIAADVVMLSFAEPSAMLREAEAMTLVRDLVRAADHYRRVIGEPFEAGPLLSLPT